MKRTSAILAFAIFVATALSCDSTVETPDEPLVEAVEEIQLDELLVGLWERDIDQITIGWLFKEGGVFQLGEPRPFFPVVGTWKLQGDTLEVTDPACLDRGFYRIEIDDEELTAVAIDESCSGRRSTLTATWYRFVYGQ
ncbi:MAG: hypothetical protein R3178_08255, partial [Rhodothermales bacterium]|nr:hypothetical protein [Rhodothermales bacterium]